MATNMYSKNTTICDQDRIKGQGPMDGAGFWMYDSEVSYGIYFCLFPCSESTVFFLFPLNHKYGSRQIIAR